MKLYDKTQGFDGTIDPRTFDNPLTDHPDLPPNGIARIKAQYKAKVSLVDRWLGVFLDALEETGLSGRTAVIATADHGTNLGDRPGGRRFHKQGPPRANEARVPCIVHVPGVGNGESTKIVQPQDLFATVLGIAGAGEEQLPEIDSYDIVKSASRASPGEREVALCGSHVAGWSGRQGKILFSVFDEEWSLGLAADPECSELQRLGSQEEVSAAFPEVVQRLWKAGIAEIKRRGLDPALAAWLESRGRAEFPASYKTTDTHPLPPQWKQYWRWLYRGR